MSSSLRHKLEQVNDRYFPRKLRHAPHWLVLGVNNVCNLHCKMCDVGTGTTDTNFAQNLVGTQPLNMPVGLLKTVMDQAAEYWPKVKIGYAFTEPLVYPALAESLEYAQQKKLYTSITTNALTLKKSAADLCRTGLNDIFISLDGPQEVHNFIRGHKSSFQRAIEGIEALLQEKKRPRISVFCVITEWNVEHLAELAEFFKGYPLEQIGFMHTNFTPDHIAAHHNAQYGEKYPATASNVVETHVSETNLDRLWEEIQRLRKIDAPFKITFSPEINSREALDVFYKKPEQLVGKRCYDVFRNMMIKSDGSVIPAHGRCYNLTVGNLYKADLKTIWNSDVFAEFRSDLVKAGGLLPACSRCCSALA